MHMQNSRLYAFAAELELFLGASELDYQIAEDLFTDAFMTA